MEQTTSPGREPGSDLPSGQPWIIRHGWLLSAVWLVFLAFPLFSAWDSSSSMERKIGLTVLVIIFGGVYIAGFHRQHQVEQAALFSPSSTGDELPAMGSRFLIALVVIGVAAYWLIGIAALGVVPFIVSFAVFNLRWPVVFAVFAAGLGATILVPLATGTLDDIWYLSLVVLAVGSFNMLIRQFSGHQVEQNQLTTSLAISDERGRMARDVHDVLGHSLTAVILKAELSQRLLEQIESVTDADQARIDACRDQLTELRSISRSALAEIRSTVGGLRAANLADEITVARTVLADAGVGLLVTGEPSDVPQAKRQTLAWVVREAVTNIVRHAKASNCHIELAPEPGQVWLRISDDGIGLPAGEGAADRGRSTTTEGNGLRGLRERVATIGAQLHITSDGGTRLEVVR